MSDKEDRNRRFYHFVIDQTRRQQWISKAVESEWLQKATFDLDIEPFEARALILEAAASRNVFIQTEIERALDKFVSLFCDPKGRIDKNAFRKLATVVKAMSDGVLDDNNSNQLVKNAVVRKEIKPRGRGLLRSTSWFRAVGLQEAKT